MPLIAMTREMGSLGKDVATGLADELGMEIAHSEVVEGALARRMQVAESEVHRFLEGGAGFMERLRTDHSTLARMTEEEVLARAARGNVVIRGWGATHVLGQLPHVACVRVCAPLNFRVKTLMERLGVDDEAPARGEIERNDAAHARALHDMMAPDWRDPTHYHMVLNTARVPVAQCVAQVRALLPCEALAETDASRAALDCRLHRIPG